MRGEQKREVSLEVLNYKKNGDRFWNLLSMMPVPDAAGNVVSYIGVQSDITELIRRRHAERELQDAKVGHGCGACFGTGVHARRGMCAAIHRQDVPCGHAASNAELHPNESNAASERQIALKWCRVLVRAALVQGVLDECRTEQGALGRCPSGQWASRRHMCRHAWRRWRRRRLRRPSPCSWPT